jgi:hypothetical protein
MFTDNVSTCLNCIIRQFGTIVNTCLFCTIVKFTNVSAWVLCTIVFPRVTEFPNWPHEARSFFYLNLFKKIKLSKTLSLIPFVLCYSPLVICRRNVCGVRMCFSKCSHLRGMKPCNRSDSMQHVHELRTKDRDYWTCEISVIPRKKCLFLFIVEMIPYINNLRSDSFTILAFQRRL